MTSDTHTAKSRRQHDGKRARNWLERQLEWEQILAALRHAGRERTHAEPPDPK